MPTAPIPPEEQTRLNLLAAHQLLDSGADEQFNLITQSAREILDVPVALISLLDKERQWFKSCVGLEISETPREQSFCAYTILDNKPLLIEDATLDERTSKNPLVTGSPGIRSYLGVPVVLEGIRIGALCCIDFDSRSFSATEIRSLQALAQWAGREFELQDQNQLLRQVNESRQRAAQLFSQAPYPLMQIFVDGSVQDQNDLALDFWRYHLGFVPNLLHDERFSHVDLRGSLAEALEGGEAEIDPFPLVNKRGKTVYLKCKLKALLTNSERLSYLVGLENVSEQVFSSNKLSRLTARLEQAEDELDRFHKNRNEFVARLGHELRNPLSGILGLVELLKDDEGFTRENISALSSCADALVALVDDSLDLARLHQGRLSIEDRPFNLAQLLKNVGRAADTQWTSKEIKLRVRLSLDCETFQGDAQKVRQIVSNLVSNAYKYTESGIVEIKAFRLEERLVISVSDTGQGMSDELTSKIFRPYYQEQSDASDSKGGVGLGLAIVNQIVQALEGEIQVQSEPGKGSTFTVSLPLSPCSVREEADEEATLDLSILVVDDNAINRKIMAMQLNNLGCDVKTAQNGAECLKFLSRSETDVVLMDCQMPVLDGYQTSEHIRKEPDRYGEPYIMALTGGAHSNAKELCLAAGMDDFVKKPVRIEDLQDKLQALKVGVLDS